MFSFTKKLSKFQIVLLCFFLGAGVIYVIVTLNWDFVENIYQHIGPIIDMIGTIQDCYDIIDSAKNLYNALRNKHDSDDTSPPPSKCPKDKLEEGDNVVFDFGAGEQVEIALDDRKVKEAQIETTQMSQKK